MFNIELFFDDLVRHLKSREETIRSLSVMTGLERWVQFEAAALLDKKRSAYDLGAPNISPDTWITCEHDGVDIWIEPKESPSYMIELKAVHNNKNFVSKINEIRIDLSTRGKQSLACSMTVKRYGVVELTYQQFTVTGQGEYIYLRDQPRGAISTRASFLTRFNALLCEPPQVVRGGSPLRWTLETAKRLSSALD